MALTEFQVKNAKPGEKSYQLPDREGLYLEVKPSGSKLWRFRYRFKGKEHRLSLGEYPYIGLKEARDIHFGMRRDIARGQDPKVVRDAVRQQDEAAVKNTFEAVAREWLGVNKDKWVLNHLHTIEQRLEKNILPWLGSRSLDTITPSEVLEVMRRIEARGANETAHRCRNICSQIFRYGMVTERCSRDPCEALRGALAPVQKEHMAAVTDPAEVGRILRMIHAYQPGSIVGAALRLHPLLFCRPGELRQMEWSQVDLGAAEWRFTLSKTQQAHITPLSRQAVAILQELYPVTGSGRYVFPSARMSSRPMSNMACLVALRSMGITQEEMTNHGWRAVARTLLDERLNFAPHLIEQQLGHIVRDPLGRAYNRTTHLESRRQMMQVWADYLDSLR